MSNQTDDVRLRHMLDHAREAISLAQGRTRRDLERNPAATKSRSPSGDRGRSGQPRVRRHSPALPTDSLGANRGYAEPADSRL
jgi:hypothetical protein